MVTDTPIPAATVLLLRDRPAFEVLMIARHESSVFAGGALVFPGGRVDPGDGDPDWRKHANGLAADPTVAAAQVAAIREAYEEAGVLLAREKSGAIVSGAVTLALSGFRASVEKSDALFMEMIAREGLTLAADALCLFSHWVAPPALHRRFDTLFFAARFPAGQQVLEDGLEATEALWIAPADAVEARRKGTRKIIFPTVRNLELLGVSQSVDAVFDDARRRPIRPVTPIVETRDGRPVLTIPTDLGYPVTEEPVETATRY